MSLVQSILNCSEDEALAIVGLRLARMGRTRTVAAGELMQLEDGLDLCTPDDRRQIEEEQRAVRHDEEDFKTLLEQYTLARSRLSKGKPRASHAPHAPLPKDIKQSEVRRFCPPGASIWRNNLQGGWCGHCPPYARTSCLSSLAGGERAALEAVLRTLWRQFVTLEGLDLSACTIVGLFPSAEVSASRGVVGGNSGESLGEAMGAPGPAARARTKTSAKAASAPSRVQPSGGSGAASSSSAGPGRGKRAPK